MKSTRIASPTQPIKLGPEGPVICRMQQEDTRSRFFYKGGPYLWTISISDPCCIHIQILICQIPIYHINTEPGIYLFDIPYQYCCCPGPQRVKIIIGGGFDPLLLLEACAMRQRGEMPCESVPMHAISQMRVAQKGLVMFIISFTFPLATPLLPEVKT